MYWFFASGLWILLFVAVCLSLWYYLEEKAKREKRLKDLENKIRELEEKSRFLIELSALLF